MTNSFLLPKWLTPRPLVDGVSQFRFWVFANNPSTSTMPSSSMSSSCWWFLPQFGFWVFAINFTMSSCWLCSGFWVRHYCNHLLDSKLVLQTLERHRNLINKDFIINIPFYTPYLPFKPKSGSRYNNDSHSAAVTTVCDCRHQQANSPLCFLVYVYVLTNLHSQLLWLPVFLGGIYQLI